MSVESQNNNKRIAKNTLLLYARMILLMLISLYTSRVILNVLGVDDYGIYNVVGGVVAMFSMISASLSTAISRFLTYEIGRDDKSRLRLIFSSSVTIQAGLAIIILLLAETIGLWFLNTQLVIPDDRILAANWCYQLSLITFSINLISVPYNASIIAHENMSVFAYISIVEAIGQLFIAWLINYSPVDKLIFYGVLLCLHATTIRLIYGIYCKRNFEECHYYFVFDKALLKQMFGFTGWNMVGTCSAILRTQGNNILINVFFGPAVNGAQAIAAKVNAVVSSFVQNFMIALNPQITKSYAVGNMAYMFKLVFQGGRLSFYLILMLALPIILNTHYILVIWLKIVPEYTVSFIQLILILELCESLSHTMVTAILAQGNIKKYMLIVGGFQMLNVPINLILFYIGCQPYIIYIVAIVISQVCLAARLILLNKIMGLNIKKFIKTVYFNVIVVATLSSILPSILSYYFNNTAISFIFVSFVAVINVALVEYFIGCTQEERLFVKSKISQMLSRKR